MGSLKDFIGMDLQLAIQRTRRVMNFCIACCKRDGLFPHFSFLRHARVASNQILGVLLAPIDWLMIPNNRSRTLCLDLILLQKFEISSCGHPMHVGDAGESTLHKPVQEVGLSGALYKSLVQTRSRHQQT